MRRLLFCIVGLLLVSGCKTMGIKEQASFVTEVTIDFSEFAEQGFLITPQDYGGDFLTIGMVTMDFHPEIVKVAPQSVYGLKQRGELVIVQPSSNNGYHYKKVSGRDALRQFVKSAQDRGGDGIINFELSSTGDYGATVRMSGYVIKRNK